MPQAIEYDEVLERYFLGSKQIPLLTIYWCLVRSLLEYGMEAYFFSAISHVVSLVKLQNEALRLCTDTMRSTPTMCLQHACNEMPLELKHRLLCCKYRAHLQTLPTHPAKTIIKDCWQELFPDFGNFCSFNTVRSQILCHLTAKATCGRTKSPFTIPCRFRTHNCYNAISLKV